MQTAVPVFYRVCRWILKAATGFYFKRIERFHRERVPRTGPLLFTSNHPNSLTDAFIIGTSVPRKVNFVATVRLFQYRATRWLLTRCGVIAINRVADDPRSMRTVKGTFEACFQVLERGEAVAIFPEGITHDDPQLKEVKTGAARMALELEHRHGGKLGLLIMPVGLTFSAKELYRSDVLANFGQPLCVAGWLDIYAANRHDAIQQLTVEIEHRIETLILHLRELQRARIIQAVKRLYLDRLLVANRVIHEPVTPAARELMLTQAIAGAVDFTYEHHPETVADFAHKLDHFEHCLHRLRLPEDELAHLGSERHLLWKSLAWFGAGLVLLPVAIFGWVHRALPVLVVNRAIRQVQRHTDDTKTRVSTTVLLAGAVSFSVCYCVYIAIVHAIFGFPVSLAYGLSLPVTGLLAHWYWGACRRFIAGLRCASILLRAPSAAKHLLALRNELIAQIESTRWRVPTEALTPQTAH